MWFLTNQVLLDRERKNFIELQKNAPWLTGLTWTLESGHIGVDAVIRVHDVDYAVRLAYPAHFPNVPPAVYPKDKERRWSLHQYGPGGSLCLEWGPDNWLPDVTGASVLTSAYNLLNIENPLGNTSRAIEVHAPSRHHLAVGAELRNHHFRVFVTRELRALIKSLGPHTAVPFVHVYDFHPGAWKTSIISIELPGQLWKDTRIPTRTDFYQGVFVKVASEEKLKDATGLEALERMGVSEVVITEQIEAAKRANKTDFGLLVANAEGEVKFYLVGVERTVIAFDAIYEEAEVFRLPLELTTLADKKVAVVGVGSLGSKVAVTLARSGVRNFYLVDYDIFMPDNIKRHILTWKEVGVHKLDAVKDVLLNIDSNINVEARAIDLTGQESAAYLDLCLQKIAECDLIVDATADERVFNLLSAIVNQEKKKFVWGAILEGGKAGFIARSLPKIDPDPQRIRAAYNEFCSKNPGPAGAPAGPYGVQGSDGKVMIASDAAVGAIGHHLAGLAIDGLLEGSEYDYAMYLIGLGKWWVFKSPLHVIPIDCGGSGPAPAASSETLSNDHTNFLTNLLNQGFQDASKVTEGSS